MSSKFLGQTDPLARATAAATLSVGSELPVGAGAELAEAVASDADARVRSAALTGLVRLQAAEADAAWGVAVQDKDRNVRRRACELAPQLDASETVTGLLGLLADTDPLVAESAAWALGEIPDASVEVVSALARVATSHEDPLVRESAVAALGSIGNPEGLPAILQACTDKPNVRRRAVLALAPFEGPEVNAALEKALADSDWQVRQAAEDLTGK